MRGVSCLEGLDKVVPLWDHTGMSNSTYTAWDLIGFDGTTEVIDRNLGGDPNYAEPEYEAAPAMVRIKGGRALYESVGNEGGATVRLMRLNDDLTVVVRYVDPDTELEVILG